MENITIGTDAVSGTISLEKPAALVFSIPMSDGWSITDNGLPVETKTSAGAFLACELEAGEHEIRLTYTTPGLCTGAILSALSLAALVILARRRPGKGASL